MPCKVKPIHWVEVFKPTSWRAATVIGNFTIIKGIGPNARWDLRSSCSAGAPVYHMGYFQEVEAAKEAAEKFYKQQIFKALEVQNGTQD